VVARESTVALGRRIRAARRNRLSNISLEVFARELSRLMGRGRAYSNVTASNWETGRKEPSWEALVAMARLIRCQSRS
jgi:transcriptional regulator with XRE-family HTH domain